MHKTAITCTLGLWSALECNAISVNYGINQELVGIRNSVHAPGGRVTKVSILSVFKLSSFNLYTLITIYIVPLCNYHHYLVIKIPLYRVSENTSCCG